MKLQIKSQWILSDSNYVKFLMWAAASANESHLMEKGFAHFRKFCNVCEDSYYKYIQRAIREGELKREGNNLFLSGQCLETRNCKVDREPLHKMSGSNRTKQSNLQENLSGEQNRLTQNVREETVELFSVSGLKDIFNSVFKGTNVPQVERITPKRLAAAGKYANAKGFKEFEEVCKYVVKKDFYTGSNDRGWTVTFDFLLNENKFRPLLEQAKQPAARSKNTRANADAGWLEINVQNLQTKPSQTEPTDMSWLEEPGYALAEA